MDTSYLFKIKLQLTIKSKELLSSQFLPGRELSLNHTQQTIKAILLFTLVLELLGSAINLKKNK